MNLPSVKTLQAGLGLTVDQAKELRAAMERRCGLKTANRLLNAFGVESIGLPDGCFDRCETPEVDIRYVNRGDTYDTTLCRVNGRYVVASWGDLVERYEK